jgi:D-arabinose 1-dehydrogenase-like Zn-dependent alcohol dehydrogenase
MKAIQIQGPGIIELVDMEKPTPGPHWARIRVCAAALCMTDFAVLEAVATFNEIITHRYKLGD